MGADAYADQRCGICGEPWRDLDGKVVHPSDKYCYRYLSPEPDRIPNAVSVNMPGKYDPRNLRRNPKDTAVGSESFKIPRPDPSGVVQAFGVPVDMKEFDS